MENKGKEIKGRQKRREKDTRPLN